MSSFTLRSGFKLLIRLPLHAWRGIKRLVWFAAQFFVGVALAFAIPFLAGLLAVPTSLDQAYRSLHPDLPMCQSGLAQGWPIIAQVAAAPKIATNADEDGWIDSTNDENAAIALDKDWEAKFRCALQRHIIPSAQKRPIDYYLSFLEFKENGDPYSLEWRGANGDEPLSGDQLKALLPPDYLSLDRAHQIDALPITQLDVLRHHLMEIPSNYVIVFAHGWRHDARVGDSNVADLRHYAAHVVRFLAQRCEEERIYCDTKVTAVYIGWRGARINETRLREWLGDIVGGGLAGLAAGTTLFDRKPISEQVAPGAISALRTIQRDVLWPNASPDRPDPGRPINKMIVFGHSLGGNLFASGLEADFIKAVSRHVPGEQLPPALGNLVVLINPAAEATKWTSIQREVWNRIPYQPDSVTSMDAISKSHSFFPVTQKPVLLSVTAALAFPAGGLRQSDCDWLALQANDSFTAERARIQRDLNTSKGLFQDGVDYDWATHVIFPAFKLDFKSLAQWFDRKAAYTQDLPPPGKACHTGEPTFWAKVASLPYEIMSNMLRNFPFQNTNPELTHTIGNLDPLRPAGGVLINKRVVPAAPFGTTHELYGLVRQERHNAYSTLADAVIDCPPANDWLRRSRQHERFAPSGTNWDSIVLKTCDASAPQGLKECGPAAQFIHGFNNAGRQPITRANDPFWNMRALNVLSRHDGYRLSSFICAMNQLVMDDIAISNP